MKKTNKKDTTIKKLKEKKKKELKSEKTVKLTKEKIDKTSKQYYRCYYNQLKESQTEMKDYNKFRMAFPSLKDDKTEIIAKNQMQSNKKTVKDFGIFIKTELPIGSFAFCNNFIYLGLKSDSKPFNVFEIKKGKASLMILDKNLEFLGEYNFENGDIIDIQCDDEHVFILFTDGSLIKMKCGDILKKKEHNIESAIENKMKIVNFSVENGNVAITDGFSIFFNEKSIKLKNMLTQILILDQTVYFLDIQSKVYKINSDFQNMTEILSDYRIIEIKKVNHLIVAILDNNEFQILNLETDLKEKVNFYGFFCHLGKGIISYFKQHRGRKKRSNLFQIVDNATETKIEQNLDNFIAQEGVFIPKIIDSGEEILIALESGMILKLEYI